MARSKSSKSPGTPCWVWVSTSTSLDIADSMATSLFGACANTGPDKVIASVSTIIQGNVGIIYLLLFKTHFRAQFGGQGGLHLLEFLELFFRLIIVEAL